MAHGYTPDPLQEAAYTPVPGLLHKYPSRALLIAAGGCAVNCRYCFRRHFPYSQHLPSDRLEQWLGYIAAHPEISEVILSGGDPLLCGNALLQRFIGAVERMPHIRSLRIHTRIPVVLPERVEPGLLEVLKGASVPIVLALHSNCAAEIDESVVRALHQLHRCGVLLLNQSVLLQGVNDSVEALSSLSMALQRARVLPYYLFLLDPVQGSAHFDVPLERALALHEGLRRALPRYLVPRLAQEVPGEPHKRVLAG